MHPRFLDWFKERLPGSEGHRRGGKKSNKGRKKEGETFFPEKY